MVNASSEVYRFGVFQLDVHGGALTRDGRLVQLTPKIFELLVYLVRREGRVVSREELLSVIWPDVTVTDGSLSRAICELRKVLGENARSPVYVFTAARRGIRFAPREPRLQYRRRPPTSCSFATQSFHCSSAITLSDEATA